MHGDLFERNTHLYMHKGQKVGRAIIHRWGKIYFTIRSIIFCSTVGCLLGLQYMKLAMNVGCRLHPVRVTIMCLYHARWTCHLAQWRPPKCNPQEVAGEQYSLPIRVYHETHPHILQSLASYLLCNIRVWVRCLSGICVFTNMAKSEQ